MRRGRPALGVLIALLVAGPAAGAETPRAERPTYAVGDRWVRNDGVYELIRVEADRYVFAASAERQIHLSRDLMPAKIQKGLGLLEFDPPPKLQWPLAVGKSGSSWGTWRWEGNSAGAYTKFLWSVAAYEGVRVPAGRLKAFRIDLRLESFRGQGPQRTPRAAEMKIWYSPEARQLVKIEGTNFKGVHWGFPSFQLAAVERPAPLAIALEQPADAARAESDQALVKGAARSGAGVAQLIVTVNGTEVARRESATTPTAELDFSVPIKLGAGKNLVLVTAVDAAGDRRQEARVIVREAAPATPPPPGKPAPVEARRALESKPAPEATSAPGPPAKPGPEPKSVEAPRAPKPAPVAPAPAAAPTPATPPVQIAAVPPPAITPPPSPVTPFTIALSSPADRTRTEQESAVLAGIVSAGRGVARVIVTVNGAEVARQEERAPQRAVALNVPLKLREGTNTIVVTAADADGALSQELRSVQYERLMPLTVALRYPEDRARLTEDASVVAGLVTSSKGVASVNVLLNGAVVWTQAERMVPKSVAIAVPVTFRAGANAIVVTATEPDGTVRQEVRTVVYDAPRVAATPPPPPAPTVPARDTWAVVIGVGRYESPDVPRLRYTVADADAVYQTLIGPAGFRKEHVLLLTDTSEKKPTLKNIKWALGTFLGRSAKKDDTVLIFFAGHGAPEVDTRGLERDGLAKYLIPSDADPDDLYSTALPMDELQTIFGRIEAERVVAFLDACYSGAAGGRTFAAKKTRAGSVDDLFLERLTRSKGRAIMTASRPSEVSIELPELGHGIFTYYLVHGLKGAADLNRDGIVSLQELYEYVEQQVTTKSRAVGGNQHPVMKGELEGVLPLAKVRGR